MKKRAVRQMFLEEVVLSGDETKLEAYETYVKEHNKKLRRLQREQDGTNMKEPPV